MEIEEEREQSHLVNLLSDNSITTIEVGETRLLLWLLSLWKQHEEGSRC